MLVGVLLAFAQTVVAAPTVTTGGKSSLKTASCYDFNNYVPANDSPVTGGSTVVLIYSVDATYWTLTYFFGKVCTNIPVVYAANTTQEPNGTIGKLSKASASTGNWYTSGNKDAIARSFLDPDSFVNGRNTVGLYAVCPNNTAGIRTTAYQRSDGVPVAPNVNANDIGYTTNQWVNPLSMATVIASYNFVCVKTDTTQ